MSAATGPLAGATTGATTLTRHIAADHPAFAGHFPGRPVLPGVVLLAEVLDAVASLPALAAALGDQPVLRSAKFLAPVGPGSTLTIELTGDARGVEFEIRCAGVGVAKGRLVREADSG